MFITPHQTTPGFLGVPKSRFLISEHVPAIPVDPIGDHGTADEKRIGRVDRVPAVFISHLDAIRRFRGVVYTEPPPPAKAYVPLHLPSF